MHDPIAEPLVQPSGPRAHAARRPARQRDAATGLAGPWRVELVASRRLTFVLLVAHLSALAAVALAGMPPAAAWPLALLIACSGWFNVRQVARLSRPGAIVGLLAWPDGTVVVDRADGRVRHGRLLGSSVVGAQLTLVRLRLEGERTGHTVPLTGDNCDPSRLRRLRVGLAWQAGPALQRRQHAD